VLTQPRPQEVSKQGGHRGKNEEKGAKLDMQELINKGAGSQGLGMKGETY
jgi:hypothetical protein